MKTLFFFFAMVIFCYPQEEPVPPPVYPINNFPSTNENIAQPDEVLVVYRDTTSSVSDTLSMYIKNYYTLKRGIPEINSLGLSLP